MGAGNVACAQTASRQAADTTGVSHAALYEILVQDFSPRGDFKGVIEGLDQIQATGVNTLWIMPVQPIGVINRKGQLGSPYAISDYRAFNPSFGTADDFRALVRAAHERGMKVILDWVPDHTAPDHAWVKQHPDWYFKNDKGEPSVPRDGNGNLTDWTDVVQLDYKNPELRREMIATMRWWIEEFNLDGFRVDVAGFIPYDFQEEAITELRRAVPRRLLMLAEWGDLELTRRGYDLVYAWDTYARLKQIWKGGTASNFVAKEVEELSHMPPGGMRMRFTTNHDETSWDQPPPVLFGPGAASRAAFVALALLPGRPLLYNGQEVESPQKLNLFTKEAVQWDQPDGAAARDFYSEIVELATTNPDFISGPLDTVIVDNPADVIAYRRGNSIVLVNPRSRAVSVALNQTAGGRDLLSGKPLEGTRIHLSPYEVAILEVPRH
jgi:glycosidase